MQAISNYRQSGGHVTETSNFGNDPLEFFPEKQLFRDQAFKEKFPSFNIVYHQLVNNNDKMFQDEIKYVVDLTYRLSHTVLCIPFCSLIIVYTCFQL